MKAELPIKKNPKQTRSRKKVSRILKATCTLLANRTFDKLTTRHIAEESGVTVGSIYQYFPNKQAILYALASEWFGDVNKKTSEHISRYISNNDPVELMKDLFTFFAVDYQSPIRGAEIELSRALSAFPELVQLDEENKLKQASLFAEVFRSCGSKWKEEQLIEYCLFIYDVFLTISFQVSNAADEQKMRLLTWSLGIVEALSIRPLQFEAN